jgi:hypothetical protein
LQAPKNKLVEMNRISARILISATDSSQPSLVAPLGLTSGSTRWPRNS